MEIIKLKNKVTAYIKKYRYTALILCIGLFLVMTPAKNRNTTPSEEETTPPTESTEVRLASILSSVSGVGKVEVILTERTGEETVFQTDEDETKSDTAYGKESETIIVTNTDKKETGLVRQIIPPQYLGAIVVCQGADKPSVKLAVIDAVSKATGLGADQIAVLKMN